MAPKLRLLPDPKPSSSDFLSASEAADLLGQKCLTLEFMDRQEGPKPFLQKGVLTYSRQEIIDHICADVFKSSSKPGPKGMQVSPSKEGFLVEFTHLGKPYTFTFLGRSELAAIAYGAIKYLVVQTMNPTPELDLVPNSKPKKR